MKVLSGKVPLRALEHLHNLLGLQCFLPWVPIQDVRRFPFHVSLLYWLLLFLHMVDTVSSILPFGIPSAPEHYK